MTKKASQLPGYKLRLLRQQLARRKANLLDPQWKGPQPDGWDVLKHRVLRDQHFPQWDASMTTAGYIDQFQRINHHTRPSSVLTFTHSAGVPTLPTEEEA